MPPGYASITDVRLHLHNPDRPPSRRLRPKPIPSYRVRPFYGGSHSPLLALVNPTFPRKLDNPRKATEVPSVCVRALSLPLLLPWRSYAWLCYCTSILSGLPCSMRPFRASSTPLLVSGTIQIRMMHRCSPHMHASIRCRLLTWSGPCPTYVASKHCCYS